MEDDRPTSESNDHTFEARRRFLKSCGKYAVATPPAITLLLSAAGPNYALAASGRSDTGLNSGNPELPGWDPRTQKQGQSATK